jgi:hypothetical protein
MPKTRITVTAGQVEAWTSGDGDPMKVLGDALLKASERVSRDGEKSAEVLIVIIP